jgi:hypothetical protein
LSLGQVSGQTAAAGALASVDGPNGSALDFYAVGKTVVIVQDFAGGNGCEVYFSRSESQLKGLYKAIEEIAKG